MFFLLLNINKLESSFDLIWIDKAVYVTPKTTHLLRRLTNKMVHFTPDPAFTFHQSHHFMDSLSFYDFAITTKSYEIKFFEKSFWAGQRTDTICYKFTPFYQLIPAKLLVRAVYR